MRSSPWVFLALVLAAASRLAAQQMVVEFDPAQTEIHWTVDSTLHTVHGTFKLKRGTIRIDAATGKAGGEIVIDVTSGESGNGARDRRMRGEILESVRFPDATFTPDRVGQRFAPDAASQQVDVHGSFLFHGSPHEMTLPVQVLQQGGKLTASTHFKVPYIAWGLKDPSKFVFKVAPEVNVEVAGVGRLHGP